MANRGFSAINVVVVPVRLWLSKLLTLTGRSWLERSNVVNLAIG